MAESVVAIVEQLDPFIDRDEELSDIYTINDATLPDEIADDGGVGHQLEEAKASTKRRVQKCNRPVRRVHCANYV